MSYEPSEALERATVVIDCTPAGNQNKEKYYRHLAGPKGFIAQGSEFGFGKPYARGVNDEALVPGEDRFIQVVSCNTHNITTLIKTVCDDGERRLRLRARHLRLHAAGERHHPDRRLRRRRRTVGKHDDPEFGTHHARDAHRVFKTLGKDLEPVLQRGQAQHPVHALDLVPPRCSSRDTTLEEVMQRLRENPRVAMTDKRHANLIFSFGRDHGYYGRILSQTVVVLPTLDGAQQARGLRLLLHAAGRQLAAVVDRRRAVADRPRPGERQPPAAARSAAGCTEEI